MPTNSGAGSERHVEQCFATVYAEYFLLNASGLSAVITAGYTGKRVPWWKGSFDRLSACTALRIIWDSWAWYTATTRKPLVLAAADPYQGVFNYLKCVASDLVPVFSPRGFGQRFQQAVGRNALILVSLATGVAPQSGAIWRLLQQIIPGLYLCERNGRTREAELPHTAF